MQRVVELIRTHRDEIIKRWLEYARALPSAARLTSQETIDSLPALMDEIVTVISKHRRDLGLEVDDRAVALGEEIPLETPPLHSHTRVAQGYRLTEVVTEYRLLRRVILDMLNAHLADTDGDMRRRQTLHEAIDLAIGECVETYRRTRDEEKQHLIDELQAIIDQMPTGVFVVTDERSVARVNRKAQEILGSTLDAHADYEAYRLDGRPLPVEERPVVRALREGAVIQGAHLLFEREDGRRILIEVSAAPIRDREGKIVAAISTFSDVTAEQREQEALRAREEVLRLAIQSTALGTWDLNIVTGDLLWDERTTEIFGVAPGRVQSVPAFLERLHPDDRERVRGLVAASLDPARRAEYATEYRILYDSGEVRWVAARGRVLWSLLDGAERAVRFVGTAFDITERRRAEEERERLMRELQESLRIRDDFISIASHELKTPLTALSLRLHSATMAFKRAGVAEGDPLGPAAASIERARGQVKEIDALIESLLDVARIRSGRLHLALEPCDLSAIAGEVAARHADAFAEKRCPLRLELEPGLTGEWDPMRLGEVVSNLVSNALRYACKEPGEVTVETRRRDGRARFSIRDHGPGIPLDVQPRLFHRFERGAEKTGPGLGLGLWISRQIVEAHGGTIGVESEPGAGAAFTVELPLAPQDGAR